MFWFGKSIQFDRIQFNPIHNVGGGPLFIHVSQKLVKSAIAFTIHYSIQLEDILSQYD